MDFYKSNYYHFVSILVISIVLLITLIYVFSIGTGWQFYHFTILVLLVIFYFKTIGKPSLRLTEEKLNFNRGSWAGKDEEIDLNKISKLEMKGKNIYVSKRLIINYANNKGENKIKVVNLGLIKNWQILVENLKKYSKKDIIAT